MLPHLMRNRNDEKKEHSYFYDSGRIDSIRNNIFSVLKLKNLIGHDKYSAVFTLI